MRRFSHEDKLSRTHDMLSTELDQEMVLMSIDAGAYYGLAGPARSIWEKLEKPLTFSALVDQLVLEYKVTPEACAADLQGFLGQMEREGLLRVE
jgi:Coenzyme PQQ synthesis protein D (PqqD)